MIRLIIPSIEEDDLQSVREVLASGFLVQGKQVGEFENIVARHVGTTYAVAVSNCTAALHLSLLALDVRPGDLVVVTSYSWLSTANVIELCGAQPIFVDICPKSFNISPECLEETLKRLMAVPDTARRVKAILPVHTFGQMADMPKIMQIADKYDLPVVEDAACALGASIQGRRAGMWGVMGCFSFHPRKAVTTGEGGIITTNDTGLVRKLRALRNHGLDPAASKPDFMMPGFNYRMTEFQAALGIAQMSKLDRIIAARRRMADRYNAILHNSTIRIPYVPEESKPVYQSYVVLLPEDLPISRGELISDLKEKGIETNIGTYHMPMTSYFQSRYGYREHDFPMSVQVFERSLTLPLFETITESQVRFVCRTLTEIIERGSRIALT